MILRYACNCVDGRTVKGEAKSDSSGRGPITHADDAYIREVLETALSSTLIGDLSRIR